jgi:hypothetical protein
MLEDIRAAHLHASALLTEYESVLGGEQKKLPTLVRGMQNELDDNMHEVEKTAVDNATA